MGRSKASDARRCAAARGKHEGRVPLPFSTGPSGRSSASARSLHAHLATSARSSARVVCVHCVEMEEANPISFAYRKTVCVLYVLTRLESQGRELYVRKVGPAHLMILKLQLYASCRCALADGSAREI